MAPILARLRLKRASLLGPVSGAFKTSHKLPPDSRRSAYLAWGAVCLLWGTTYLGIRVAIETIPPLIMAGFRWATAGTVILAALKIRGEKIPPRSHWLAMTVLGVLLIGLGNGCVVWAEQTLPSGL